MIWLIISVALIAAALSGTHTAVIHAARCNFAGANRTWMTDVTRLMRAIKQAIPAAEHLAVVTFMALATVDRLHVFGLIHHMLAALSAKGA